MYSAFLSRNNFQSLIDYLVEQDYSVIAPTIKQDAIHYQPIHHIDEMVCSYHEQSSAGSYQLVKDQSGKYFNWSNGVSCLKPWFFKPHETLWQLNLNKTPPQYQAIIPKEQKKAFIGVRACDLAALQLQDQHFLQDKYLHQQYHANRQQSIFIAVHCAAPSTNCFCTSTEDGPECSQGFDIVMTELESGFILQGENTFSQKLIDHLPVETVSKQSWQEQDDILKRAKQKIQRAFNPEKVAKKLQQRLHDNIWQDIAEKCLACGNCTLVCPSCFCSKQGDEMPLAGNKVEHIQYWDSCFSEQHSYLGGIVIHQNIADRYKQWINHKLNWWFEQYGRSGCVGCGRCISWCPTGIDFFQQARALTENASS